MVKLTNNWLMGAILLLSVLASCSDDKVNKMVVWFWQNNNKKFKFNCFLTPKLKIDKFK